MISCIIMQVILREHNGAIFRRCEPSDLIGVMEINMKTLPEHYSDYFYESLLVEAPEAFLIAEKSSLHVGYIMCKTEFGFSNFKKLGFTEIETSTPTEFIINLNTWQRTHYSQFRNKNDWNKIVSTK